MIQLSIVVTIVGFAVVFCGLGGKKEKREEEGTKRGKRGIERFSFFFFPFEDGIDLCETYQGLGCFL